MVEGFVDVLGRRASRAEHGENAKGNGRGTLNGRVVELDLERVFLGRIASHGQGEEAIWRAKFVLVQLANRDRLPGENATGKG